MNCCKLASRQILKRPMITLLVITYPVSFLQAAVLPVETDRFFKAGWCSGQALQAAQRYHTQAARSSVGCVIRCRSDSSCLSAEFDTVNKLCHLSAVTAAPDCANMEPATDILHYERTAQILSPCLNGGTVNASGSCVCLELYCGPTCEQVVQDCVDVKQCQGLSLTPPEARWIWPSTSPSPFQVLCQGVGANARTFIARRTLPTVNFNRSWDDYKNGFGSMTSEWNQNHWLGLEKIHQITNNRQYMLLFALRIRNNTELFGKYPNFVLANEANGFTFSTDTSHSALKDCLSPVEGIPFSTYDNDNDGETSINCALRHGGGFWFSGPNCTTYCNPFGRLLKPLDDARTGIYDEAFWTYGSSNVDVAPFKLNVYLIHM